MKRLSGYSSIVKLFAIVLASLSIRLLLVSGGELMAYDSYHHLAIANSIVEKGEFPFFWDLSNAPQGTYISEPKGLYYISVILYYLLAWTGMDFFTVFVVTPAIFGALTLIPFYFLVKGLFNRQTAFFSVVILAFIPTFIIRGSAGFYRGDPFFVFFLVLGLFFFLRAIRSSGVQCLAFAILTGLFIGCMGTVWNGFAYGLFIFSAIIIAISGIYFLKPQPLEKILGIHIISMGLGIGIIDLFGTIHPHMLNEYISYVLPSGIVFPIFVILFNRIARVDKKTRMVSLGLIGAVAFISAMVFAPEKISAFLSGYNYFRPVDPIFANIRELQRADLELIGITFGPLVYLLPLGIILTLWNFSRKPEKVLEFTFFSVWLIPSLLLLFSVVRIHYIIAPPLAVLGGYLLSYALRPHVEIPRLRAVAPFLVMAFLAIFVAHGVDSDQEFVYTEMTPEWREALEFLGTQEEGNVMTFWNFGSWVHGVAGFPTFVDTVHGQNKERIIEMANRFFYETDQERALGYMEENKIRYVIVSTDLWFLTKSMNSYINDSGYYYSLPAFTRASREEGAEYYGNIAIVRTPNVTRAYLNQNGKIIPIQHVHHYIGNSLASDILPDDPENNLGGVLIFGNDILYMSPKIYPTLMNSLVSLEGLDFNKFKPVFENSLVRIYEPQYDYTRLGSLKMGKLHYKPGDTIRGTITMEANQPFDGIVGVLVKKDGTTLKIIHEFSAKEAQTFEFEYTIPRDYEKGEYKIEGHLYIKGEVADFVEKPFEVM